MLDALSRFDKPVSQRLVEGCHTYMAEFGKPAPTAHEWLLTVSAGQTIHETQKQKMKTNEESKLWDDYVWFSMIGLAFPGISLRLLRVLIIKQT